MLGIRNKKLDKIALFALLVIYFAAAYALMDHFNVTCVFLEIFKIPCPGCGMTRALLSLLRLDLIGAIKYNFIIFFMPYVFVYIFFDLKHRIHKTLLSIIALLAVINWIIKIILFI